MYKRLSELNFVIGLFFTIVSLVLLGDKLFNRQQSGKMDLYTGILFLTFGLFMMSIKSAKSEDKT